VGCADDGGELLLKRGDLRALGRPAREDHTSGGIGFAFIEDRFGDRDHGKVASSE
jgi:hypothetical protein